MPNHPIPTDAPFELDADRAAWLYDDAGEQRPIVARFRRTATVDHDGERIRLKRRSLERDGFDIAGERTYRVTRYQFAPDPAATAA